VRHTSQHITSEKELFNILSRSFNSEYNFRSLLGKWGMCMEHSRIATRFHAALGSVKALGDEVQ